MFLGRKWIVANLFIANIMMYISCYNMACRPMFISLALLTFWKLETS